MDDDYSNGEVVFEEDVWEVEDDDDERPPEDGVCVHILCFFHLTQYSC